MTIRTTSDDEGAALDAEKRALRTRIAGQLPQPDSAAWAAASLQAQERLRRSAPVRGAGCIALYRSLKSECATDVLAEQLTAEGKQLCFPAVVPGEAVLRFLRPHGPVRRGQLGVDEHEDAPHARVPLERIDLFVIPARAVSHDGHRLGRGKGHYDATLAAAGPRARRVCLVFDAQVVDRVPVAPHDERVDAVCTDARWIDCPERAP